MKTIIVSAHCSRVDLIEIQYKSIKKFVKGCYEYVVFNDAKQYAHITNFNNQNIHDEIADTCKKLDIQCIDIPQSLHTNRTQLFPKTSEKFNDNVSARAAISVQFMYNYFTDISDIMFVILDADMFFVDYIDFNDFSEHHICFIHQQRNDYNYMWIGIVIINNSKVHDLDKICWDCGKINNVRVDTGGQSYHWLHKYSHQINVKFIDHMFEEEYNDEHIKSSYNTNIIELCKNITKFKKTDALNLEFILNNKILHLRSSGSNWDYTNKGFLNFLSSQNKSPKPFNIHIDWQHYQLSIGKLVNSFMDELIATK